MPQEVDYAALFQYAVSLSRYGIVFCKILLNFDYKTGLCETSIGIMAIQSKKFNTTIPLSATRKAIAEALENQPPEKNRIGFSQE